MRGVLRLAVLLLGVTTVIALASAPALVRAQPPPAAQATELVRVAVPTLPGPPDPGVEVWFIRYTIDPGVTLPPSSDLGVSLIYVEQGDLTFTVEGTTVKAVRPNATPQAVPTAGGTPADVRLHTGETLLTGTGNRTGVQNASREPAIVLVLYVFSPLEEMQGTEGANATPTGQETGVGQQPLAAGGGALPEGPGTIVIERVEVRPGERTAEKTRLGIEVGAVEQGSARLTAIPPGALVWPWSKGADVDSEPIFGSAPTERMLQTGDGYALPNGVEGFLFAEGNAPATILRAVVEPQGGATSVSSCVMSFAAGPGGRTPPLPGD
jgi:hypothetical protein